MKKTGIVFLCVVCLAMGWQARAQTFDNSGNGMLNGNYYFRQVFASGDGSDLISAYGEISFNGSGAYTMNASAFDYQSAVNSGSGPGALSVSGTYSISASGLGYLSNPLSKGSLVYGLVSKGIFIGSSTQNASGFNDMFIAAPIGSGAPAFSGSYTVAFMDMYQGLSGTYQLNPSGSSSLGTVNVTYYGLNSAGASATGSSSESGVNYSSNNGAVIVNFPKSGNGLAILGQEYLYISPDGNFVFGGSPNGWDMFVGVHPTTTPTFSGLYYQAGLDLFPDAYYGSLFAIPPGTILGHQRLVSLGGTSFDDTYTDGFSLSGGSYVDGVGIHHLFGLGGALSVGYGTDGNFGINVAIQAPTLSGSGMYLNPVGIENQSSSALFTSGIAPGEYITLTGTGLVNGTHQDAKYPTTLGGIQLLVNGRAAPLYYMCKACDGGNDLIIAVVPWELTGSIVQFQVVSTAGARSNAVTLFTSQTAPGVKTQSGNGLGDAAAQHTSNFALITQQNPAQVGETIVLYAVGLGPVSPTLNDGQAAGSTPTSITLDSISVYIDGVQVPPSSISYSGLVPGVVNLYQLNVQVPSGVSAGDDSLEIIGPDSDTIEATIPIGSTGMSAAARAEAQVPRRPAPGGVNSRRVKLDMRKSGESLFD